MYISYIILFPLTLIWTWEAQNKMLQVDSRNEKSWGSSWSQSSGELAVQSAKVELGKGGDCVALKVETSYPGGVMLLINLLKSLPGWQRQRQLNSCGQTDMT